MKLNVRIEGNTICQCGRDLTETIRVFLLQVEDQLPEHFDGIEEEGLTCDCGKQIAFDVTEMHLTVTNIITMDDDGWEEEVRQFEENIYKYYP